MITWTTSQTSHPTTNTNNTGAAQRNNKKMINKIKMYYQTPQISIIKTHGVNGMIQPMETHTQKKSMPKKSFSTKNIKKAKKMEK